jgi:hypothetical protein
VRVIGVEGDGETLPAKFIYSQLNHPIFLAMPQNSPIYDVSQEIGDLLHHESLWPRIEGNVDAVAQITACRDVIEDTDWAVRAHETIPISEDTGDLYLITYGLLQALQAQQDATDLLFHATARALGLGGFKLGRRKRLAQLTRVRHDAIGHPVKGSATRDVEYYGIVQISLSRNGFDLCHWKGILGNEPPVNVPIDLRSIANEHLSIIETELRRLADRMRAETGE